MYITFLGTGPSSGIPKKNCLDLICKNTRLKNNKSRRTRSSVFIKKGGLNILIDVSPDFLIQRQKGKIKKIDNLIITHAHWDACGGIKLLNDWTKNIINVYCHRQTQNRILAKYHHLENIKFNKLKPYKKFIIAGTQILPLPVKHYVLDEKRFPTFAYKFPNFIYCSDVIKIPLKSIKYFKNCTNVILDAAIYFNKQFISHLNTKQAIDLAHQQKVKRLYLTQIGHSYPLHQIAQKTINQYVKNNNIKTKVILAFDGLKIKI